MNGTSYYPQLEVFLQNNEIPFETNVDLKRKTWIHRGGICSYFITPTDSYSLENLCHFLFEHRVKFLTLGSTTNIYIRNTTNIGVVISTTRCRDIRVTQDCICCDCGVMVNSLARSQLERGVKGFEYLTCLPGTIGGAICNNSSCRDGSITSLLIDADVAINGECVTIKRQDFNFDFRSSDIKKRILNGVILRVRLRVEYGDKDSLIAKAKENENERKSLLEGPSQNLGCTVNRLYMNGKMPIIYRVPYLLCSTFLRLLPISEDIRKKKIKEMLLFISGHSDLIPYVSDKQLLTFIWKDDGADVLFDEYLIFMENVCKTDSVEIEII